MMWTYRGPEAQCPALLGHEHEHDPGEASPSQPSTPEPSQPSEPNPGELGARPSGVGASPGPGDPDVPDVLVGSDLETGQ